MVTNYLNNYIVLKWWEVLWRKAGQGEQKVQGKGCNFRQNGQGKPH